MLSSLKKVDMSKFSIYCNKSFQTKIVPVENSPWCIGFGVCDILKYVDGLITCGPHCSLSSNGARSPSEDIPTPLTVTATTY